MGLRKSPARVQCVSIDCVIARPGWNVSLMAFQFLKKQEGYLCYFFYFISLPFPLLNLPGGEIKLNEIIFENTIWPIGGGYPAPCEDGNVSMNCQDKMIRSCFQLSVSLSALQLKYKVRTLNLWFNTSEIIDPGRVIILLDRKYWNKLFSLEMICNKWKMPENFWANNSGSDSLKRSNELIFAFTLKKQRPS